MFNKQRKRDKIMKNSLWEIRQKVKAGEPLTDDEKEALRVLELGLREVTKELMTSEIKKELRRALSAYKGKKRQWNIQKEYFRRETGFDFEFEKVFDFLITNTSTGSITLGEFLGLSDAEVDKLFDLWSVLYPDYRKKQREAIRRELSTIAPPVATSTEANQEKKGGRTNDPYNAKVKAKFLEMLIDAGEIEKKTYQNNDKKFTDYATVLNERFGLVVKAGTLENNWNKPLDEKQQKQLRDLFKDQGFRNLAVKAATKQ